jgi:hypothetical protein
MMSATTLGIMTFIIMHKDTLHNAEHRMQSAMTLGIMTFSLIHNGTQHDAECRYAEWHYAECRDTNNSPIFQKHIEESMF